MTSTVYSHCRQPIRTCPVAKLSMTACRGTRTHSNRFGLSVVVIVVAVTSCMLQLLFLTPITGANNDDNFDMDALANIASSLSSNPQILSAMSSLLASNSGSNDSPNNFGDHSSPFDAPNSLLTPPPTPAPMPVASLIVPTLAPITTMTTSTTTTAPTESADELEKKAAKRLKDLEPERAKLKQRLQRANTGVSLDLIPNPLTGGGSSGGSSSSSNGGGGGGVSLLGPIASLMPGLGGLSSLLGGPSPSGSSSSSGNSNSKPSTSSNNAGSSGSDRSSVMQTVMNAFAAGKIPPELMQMALSGKIPPQIIQMTLSGQIPPQLVEMVITGQVPTSLIKTVLDSMNSDAHHSHSHSSAAPLPPSPPLAAPVTSDVLSHTPYIPSASAVASHSPTSHVMPPRPTPSVPMNAPGTSGSSPMSMIFPSLNSLAQAAASAMPPSSSPPSGEFSSPGLVLQTPLGNMPVTVPTFGLPGPKKIGQFMGGTIANMASLFPF